MNVKPCINSRNQLHNTKMAIIQLIVVDIKKQNKNNGFIDHLLNE